MRWMGLILVFAIVLATRLFFAFSTPFFTSDEAYLHYRLVQNILATGFPGLHDALGWEGSFLNLSPLFSYLLSAFAFLLGRTVALKIIPNVFASLLVFPVYFIVRRLTRHWVGLLAAFVASFVPVFFSHTFNHVSAAALIVPLFFWLVFCWMDQRVYEFVGGIVLFSFLHPSVLILVSGLLLFALLSSIEKLGFSAAELELLLFSSGFALWAQFLMYKRAILAHGLSVFWLNIPASMVSAFFVKLGFFDVLWQVGFFPLVVGLYVLYRNAVSLKDRNIYLFLSLGVVIFFLTWLRLVEFVLGLMLLGVILVVLFSLGIPLFQEFLRQTKFASLERLFLGLIAVTIVLTSFFPAVYAAQLELSFTIEDEQVDALMWLRSTPADSVVIAPFRLGHYVTAIARRPVVLDSWFLLHEDADERFQDVDRVFESVLETEVVGILDKYDVSYVVLPPDDEDVVFTESDCFSLEYGDATRVFRKDPQCRLRVVS